MGEPIFWSMLVISGAATAVVGYLTHRADAAFLAGIYVIVVYMAMYMLSISLSLDVLQRLLTGEQRTRPEFSGILERLLQTARELTK